MKDLVESTNINLKANTAFQRLHLLFVNRPYLSYPKGSVIIDQGQLVDKIFYIIKGLVEYVHINDDGTENLIDLLCEDNVVCIPYLFSKTATTGFFIALTDTTLSLISEDEMHYYLEQDHDLAKGMIEELSKIVGGLINQMSAYTISAEQRVLEIICYLAEVSSRNTAYQKDKPINLSQFDLARISRTTRVTVTKVLGKLKDERLIMTTYGGIIVKDLNGLKNHVNNFREKIS